MGWLPVHWDQLRVQRSVTSKGENFTFLVVGIFMLQSFAVKRLTEYFSRSLHYDTVSQNKRNTEKIYATSRALSLAYNDTRSAYKPRLL